MRHFLRNLSCPLVLLGFLAEAGGTALAADLVTPAPPPVVEDPAMAPSGWNFRFVPYGWLISMNGNQSVRGRSAKVDASFLDIVENSDTLVALMGDFEARHGPFALYGDLVWTKVGVEGGSLRTRTPAPGVTTTVGRSLGLDIEMAVLEVGTSYEVARSGALAFDILAGARYWHQEADLSFEVTRTIDIGDLERVGGRAIARSRSIDWLDPILGARIRYAVTAGHNLFLRGDIGGFGVGSNFSWQAAGGYGFDVGTYQGITFSGVIGYRALYVDYVQAEGRQRYEFDMLQHGPILGISARF